MARRPDPDDTLAERLSEQPKFWFDPLRRYRETDTTPADGVDGALIGHTREGRVERVRWAIRTTTKPLLLAEYDALRAAGNEYLVDLSWSGVIADRLYVATSWVEVEERKSWPIPIQILLRQVACAARGVAALHVNGLVHGDLKPERILWEDDRALVTDLKLAAPPGSREDASYSPKFAAPEQVLGETVGPPADVYALGVTLYTQFIRGRFPTLLNTGTATEDVVDGSSLSATTMVLATPEKVSSAPTESSVVGAKVLFRSRLSGVLEGAEEAGLISSVLGIVQRACELDPEKRYPDGAALAEALEDIAR